MRAKLLIKFYLVVFVLDLIVISYATDYHWLLRIALINLVVLFGILIAHKSLFQTVDTQGHRILFSRDVFLWVALCVGMGAGLWRTRAHATPCPWRLVALLVGTSFYVITVPLFGMDREREDSFSRRKVSLGVLIALVVLGAADRGSVRTTGKNLETHYLDAVMKRQGGLQSLVVDEQVRDSQQQADQMPIDDNEPTPAEPEDNQPSPEPTQEENAGEEPIEEPASDNLGDRLFAAYANQQGNLTYGTFLPVLKEVYSLPTPTAPYTFSTISASSDLYEAFATARAYTMIGGSTSPTSQFRCQNLMVLLGLAEEWGVSYTPTNVLSVFWEEATRRGYTAFGCTDPQAYARWSDLP